MSANNSAKTRLRHLFTRVLPPLLVLIIAGFGATKLMSTAPEAGRRPAPERQARLVETVTAQPVSLPVRISAWGETRAAREVALTPQVGGRIQALHGELEPGGFLIAGTVAAEIDSRDYELQLQRARSELARAEAELALEQGQQAVARREYELLGRNVSEQEKNLILRGPQLRTAQAAVASAKASVAEAELALARTRVTVPFDALVLERHVSPGAQVSSTTEIATLAGTERWWVEIAVPLSALPWIETARADTPGSQVRLRDVSWPAGQYREGHVVRRYGSVEEQGRMARLLVEIEDPLAREAEHAGELPLLLGSFLQAEVVGRTLENVYALEPAWLRENDRVWIMSDAGELEMRQVEIAYRGERQVLVRGGLNAGERLVVTPINGATEGMLLRTADADHEDAPNAS